MHPDLPDRRAIRLPLTHSPATVRPIHAIARARP